MSLTNTTLLKVENLGVRFLMKSNMLLGKKTYLYAVDDVSFEIQRGETLAYSCEKVVLAKLLLL